MLDFFSQKNRILLREMVKTDFKLRYQGSLIGHLWSILKPLMLFTIMYLVFCSLLYVLMMEHHTMPLALNRYGYMEFLFGSDEYGDDVNCIKG